MNEIDDPIPREHAACIVRAVEINKRILKIRSGMEELHLVGIEKAFSTNRQPQTQISGKIGPAIINFSDIFPVFFTRNTAFTANKNNQQKKCCARHARCKTPGRRFISRGSAGCTGAAASARCNLPEHSLGWPRTCRRHPT